MIHLLILAVHLVAAIAKLLRPGGVRAVVAESLLLKHQLVISSRDTLGCDKTVAGGVKRGYVGDAEIPVLSMLSIF
jgi:hypothetical protein